MDLEYLNKKRAIALFGPAKWEEIKQERENKAEKITLLTKVNKPLWFVLTPKILELISKIENERGFLSQLVLSKTLQKRLIEKALNYEAYYSSHIEGAVTSLEDALLNIKAGKRKTSDESLQMILNNRQALQYLLPLSLQPFSLEMIYELQRLLIQNTHKQRPITVGAFRKGPIYVVNGLGQVVYEGPSAEKVQPMMEKFIEWLNDDHVLHPLIKAGLTHLYFVHVHPFDDGNGRSARALSNLVLDKYQYKFINLMSLSDYFDHARADYYKSLQDVQNNDFDATYFLHYYLNALLVQLDKIKQELSKETSVVKLKDILKQEKYLRLNTRQIKILQNMLKTKESISNRRYCKIVKCSDETARLDLQNLCELKIIEADGEGRSRVYNLII